MEAQLQTYLQDKGVEDLLKDIVVELCKDTPENVLQYIKDYVTKRMGDDNADESEEDDDVRQHIFHVQPPMRLNLATSAKNVCGSLPRPS